MSATTAGTKKTHPVARHVPKDTSSVVHAAVGTIIAPSAATPFDNGNCRLDLNKISKGEIRWLNVKDVKEQETARNATERAELMVCLAKPIVQNVAAPETAQFAKAQASNHKMVRSSCLATYMQTQNRQRLT